MHSLRNITPLLMLCGSLGCGNADSGASTSGVPTATPQSVPQQHCPSGQMLCGERCMPRLQPTLPALHQAVILNGCAGSRSCHTGSNPKEGLDLSTEAAVSAMVGVSSRQVPGRMLIAPGEPEQSFLMDKLRGINLPSTTPSGVPSALMPLYSNPLCDALLGLFDTWIRDGAEP